MGGGGGGGFGAGGARKGETRVYNLPLTLEELFTGVTKKLKVTRKRGGADAEKLLEVVVKPGWKKGTAVTFDSESDEVPGGGVPADIQFVIAEKPHERFLREGNDLVLRVRLSLAEALCGTRMDVPALDGRTLSLAVPEVITPGYEKRIKGEGMPLSKAPGQRGDLLLRFDVAFPSYMCVVPCGALRCVPHRTLLTPAPYRPARPQKRGKQGAAQGAAVLMRAPNPFRPPPYTPAVFRFNYTVFCSIFSPSCFFLSLPFPPFPAHPCKISQLLHRTQKPKSHRAPCWPALTARPA